MTPDEIETAVGDLEEMVERLRALYDQYFMGIEKIEPAVQRKKVDRMMWLLRREQIRNTALRFKFNQVAARYNTYATQWQRTLREIENGTYKRDVQRAAKKFGAEALTIAAKKRYKHVIDQAATEAEARAAAPQPAARSAADDDDDDELFKPSGQPAALPPKVDNQPAKPGPQRAPVAPKPALTAEEEDDELFAGLELEQPGAGRMPVPGRGFPPPPGRPIAPPPSGRMPSIPAANMGAASPRSSSPDIVVPRKPTASTPDLQASMGVPQAGPLRPSATQPVVPPATPPRAPQATQPPPVSMRPSVPVTPPRPSVPVATAQASVPAPAPAPQRPANPPVQAPKPAAPVAQAAPAKPTDLDDARVREIYGKFVESKRQCNESTAAITFDGLARSLRDTETKIRNQHAGKKVDFEVVIKDGKTVLRPVVK